MTRSVFTKEYKLFRAMLKQERQKAKLTQDVLCARLGKPNNFVSRYELGERRIDVVEFLEIAEAIGFDPVAFIKNLQK